MEREVAQRPERAAKGSACPRHVLVVGCGYLGRNMAVGLAAAGSTVSVLARREPPADVRDAALVHRGDAGDDAALRSALDGVDHVVWCAGGLLPGDAERDPGHDERATLEPLRRLVEITAGSDVTVTYMSSGGTVYGNPEAVPVAEDAPTTPIGEYGRVRLAAEHLLRDAASSGGPRARILRCANVYGGGQPADRGQGAVAVFTERVRTGREVVVFDEGRAVRDFVHVDDVVDVTGRLLGVEGPDVLNVGSGRGVSIAELLSFIERGVGRPANIVHRPGRPFDVDRIVLDITRIRGLVPFAPRDLATGLSDLRDVAAPAPRAAT